MPKKEIKEKIIEILEKPYRNTKNPYTIAMLGCANFDKEATQISELFEQEKQKWVEEIEKEIKNGKMWSRKAILWLLKKQRSKN